METMDAKVGETNQQVQELHKQLEAVRNRRAHIKAEFDAERSKLYTAESGRKGYIALLAGKDNDDSMIGYIEFEIDKLDREIVSCKRRVESYETALKNIDLEEQNLLASVRRALEMSKEERRAHAIAVWKDGIAEAFAKASDALDEARSTLGALVVLAREGRELSAYEADRLLGPLSEQFFMKQGDLGGRGFVDRYDYNREQFSFVVRPMERKA